MRSKFTFLLLTISVLSSFGAVQDQRTNPPIVCMVQLLSSPEKYDGKHVAVLGFLTIGQENNNLYLGKSDYDNALLPNSIWVDISGDMQRKLNELNMKYVRIDGAFHFGHEGQKTVSVGGIGEISDCTLVSDPGHPFSEKLKNVVRHAPSSDQ